jgi:hypothetical protein
LSGVRLQRLADLEGARVTTPTATEAPRDSPHLNETEEGRPPAEEVAVPGSQQEAAAQESDSGQGKPSADREARHRTERNEARAQLTELNERIARIQGSAATRLAADVLHNPSDLVLFGALADVVDDDGMVDPEKGADRRAES